MRPVLRIEDLTVRTLAPLRRPILDRVGFTVGQGETVCVVGESGSGKSVTALTTMGLLPRSSFARPEGTVSLTGENVLAATSRRLRALRATRMAMVFQEPMTALNPVVTVGGQIDEVLRLHSNLSREDRRSRVLEILEAVRIPDPERIYSAYPHQLSGGQRQRIVISMGLVLEPALLIADEPTTALDVTTQRQILLLIRELQQRHDTAVMFITHDFGVVSEIADRIVVMQHGQVVEVGSRDEILSSPQEPYTRMLVSSVPSLLPRRRPARPAGPPALDVAGLNKTYSERRLFSRGRIVDAVKDVSLAVCKGEITGIVGESGSGKSTVARCIVRLVDPSSGRIRIGGDEIAAVPAGRMRNLRRNFQIIFQDPFRSLNPRLRIGESLIEGMTNFGVRRSDAVARAADLMRLVDLDASAMHRFPHQFSGGQRQRIAIARALALEPDVLIADEAVSALDVSVQAQILDLFEEIRDRMGLALVFITHDLRVAAKICDTIVVMEKGRIVEQGPAERVLTAPEHDYTRMLIDAAPGRDWDFQNFRQVDAG